MKVHYSSKKSDWETPDYLFDRYEQEFGFDLDVCATAANAKCTRFLSFTDNALSMPWHGVCWMNPPYGRGIADWIAKARYEALHEKRATIVCLIPSRTDTKYWHKWIWNNNKHRPHKGVEVRFLLGRITFVGAEHPAPFPSAIVIFRGLQ